jgi:hypothetical protein
MHVNACCFFMRAWRKIGGKVSNAVYAAPARMSNYKAIAVEKKYVVLVLLRAPSVLLDVRCMW